MTASGDPSGDGRDPRPLDDPLVRTRKVALEAIAFLFFLALAAIATRPLVTDLTGQMPVGPDPVIDLWTVHWLVSHTLAPSQIFGGNVFYPAPHAVLYSDLSLGTAVLLLPARLFVSDPVPLYNIGLLLALAFSGWAFCALARHLTGSWWGGLLAGVLTAFGSHQMYHVYHLNLLTTGWLGLFLLGLHRLLERPTWGAAVLTAVSASLSAQSSGYYAVATALLGLALAAFHWRPLLNRKVLKVAASAALLAAALTLPYIVTFAAVRERDRLRRPEGMSVRMALQPARDLSSHGYVYGWLLGKEGERLFPGALCLGLAALALLRKRAGAGFYLGATVMLLLVSLGPRLEIGTAVVPLPYRWLSGLPFMNAMRHPYTFAAVACFTLSVLAGLGLASLRFPRRAWIGPVVVGLAVLETLGPPIDLRPVPPGVPPAYRLLPGLPPGPVLELPVFSEDALLWAARHGLPVVNGTGAFAPTDTLTLTRYVDNHWLRQAPEDLDRSRPTRFLLDVIEARYVILPTGRRAGYSALAEAFDRSRSFALVAEASDGDRLYEVRGYDTHPPGSGLADPGQEREQRREVP